MSEKNKELPSDYGYEGNKIPIFIKIVWTALLTWGLYYFLSYGISDLKIWINK